MSTVVISWPLTLPLVSLAHISGKEDSKTTDGASQTRKMKLPNGKRSVCVIAKTIIFLRRPPAMVVWWKQSGRNNLTSIPDTFSTTQALRSGPF